MPTNRDIAGARPWRNRTQPEAGGVLVLWAFAVAASLLVLIQSYAGLVQSTVTSGARGFLLEEALALADGGTELALWDIQRGTNINTSALWADPGTTACAQLDGDDGSDGSLYGLSVTSCRNREMTLSAGDNFGGTIGTFRVWVANFGGPVVRIVSQGFVPTAVSPVASKTVNLQLQQSGTFRSALFSHREIHMRRDAHVDSYDSSAGPYDPFLPGSNAEVGANGDNGSGYDYKIEDGLFEPALSRIRIKGRGLLPPSPKLLVDPPAEPTGGWVAEPVRALPSVYIPSELLAMTSFTTPPAGVTGTSGNYTVPSSVTWTCSSPTRVRSLKIDGSFVMQDGCKLFVDNAGLATGTFLETKTTGQIRKTGTGTSQIYLRDNGFKFKGPGLTFDASIPDSLRRPTLVQIYQTCSTQPCASNQKNSQLAQTQPFYGAVYVENGTLDLSAGQGAGGSWANGQYYGSFASKGRLTFTGEDVDTNADLIPDAFYSANVHFDESLTNLSLGGTGASGSVYQVMPASWNTRN